MASISKNVYIDKLDYIANKCNKTYDIKMNTNKGINNEDPKFKLGDILKISKYKNIFAKLYALNWYEEVFVI